MGLGQMPMGQMPMQYGPPGMSPTIHPAVLAQLQQMGLFGMRPQSPQMQQGLGYPNTNIQPYSAASVGSLR